MATKMHRPNLPQRRVKRPRLVERLNAGLKEGRTLTLISAPAGYGKTLCAAEWLESLDAPAAWLSLDAADDEPVRFFSYLLAALQAAQWQPGIEIEGLLRSGQAPPAEVIAGALVDGLMQRKERLVLALDDFHHIQHPDILAVFALLITQPPPTLHLALLTREDPPLPLARLRAYNQLTELRAADLSFRAGEVDALMGDVLGLSLSAEDVGALAGRTEGWAAGLQLAGLSLRDHPDASGFIFKLSGSHRFILSYLTQEVIQRQPADIQQFLLQTAVLERMNGELCEAVTGRSDSRALLEQLLNANLFLSPLDDEGHWYRYHHLFAGLLRERQKALMAGEVAELHRRASRWYARAANDHPEERAVFAGDAIRHALAAQDYSAALALIETHAIELLRQWYAGPVREWLEALPPEWRAHSPRANLALVWMHMMRGEFAQAGPFIEVLYGMFAANAALLEDVSVRTEWLALQATLLNAQNQPEAALALAQQALSLAPADQPNLRAQAYLALAGAYQSLGDDEQTVQAYQQIIENGRAAGELPMELLGISALGLLAIERGRLHLGYELAATGVQRIEQSGLLPPIGTAIYGELGEVHYQWGQFDQAEKHILRSAQLSAYSGFQDAHFFHDIFRSRLCTMRGDAEGASRLIEGVTSRARTDSPVVVAEEVVAQQARADLDSGRLAAAEAALKARGFEREGQFWVAELPVSERMLAPAGRLYNTALRVLLWRAARDADTDELRRGTALTGGMIETCTRHGYLPLAIEAVLLRAQMHAAAGNAPAAEVDLLQALAWGEDENFISVFLENSPETPLALARLLEGGAGRARRDYILRIIEAYRSLGGSQEPAARESAHAAGGGMVEALTGREVEVLALMAQGMTYNEIARQLVVSLNTVRSHVKSIYGKLGADNRTAAIELARGYHIL